MSQNLRWHKILNEDSRTDYNTLNKKPAELKLSGATVWRGVTRDDSIGVGPNKSPLFVAKPESDRFVMVLS